MTADGLTRRQLRLRCPHPAPIEVTRRSDAARLTDREYGVRPMRCPRCGLHWNEITTNDGGSNATTT